MENGTCLVVAVTWFLVVNVARLLVVDETSCLVVVGNSFHEMLNQQALHLLVNEAYHFGPMEIGVPCSLACVMSEEKGTNQACLSVVCWACPLG